MLDEMGGHEYRMCLDRFPEQDSNESIRESFFSWKLGKRQENQLS
jgi:hypothetical protein